MSLVTQISSGLVRLATEAKSLRTLITGSATGDLTGLNTTVKTSLVAAINEVEAGGGVDPATETSQGIVEIATQAEANAGTDTARVITPATLAVLLASLSSAVKSEILGAGVPEALNTLDELAQALGDDANFASSVTSSLAGKQPLDTDLTAIAALASAADKMPYATGSGTWALADLTAFARTLLDDANATGARGTLSVHSQAEIGDVNTDFVAIVEAGLA